MPDLHPAELRDTVQQAIDQGRLGTPKFLRIVASVDSPPLLDSVANDAEVMAEEVFQGSPTQRHTLSRSPSHVTSMLKWPDGQGALIIVGHGGSGQTSHLDLMLVGSRGTIYYGG